MPSAGPRSFRSSRAFLVRSVSAGELDRRISFFTESDGMVHVLAKSARRSRKRFGGNLQKYFLLEAAWTEVPGRIPVLESASLLESYWGIVEDWERVRHGDHLLELAAALFPQTGPKPKAFKVLLAGIRAISRGEPPRVVARKTEAAFLAIGGWGPNLSACRHCGRRPDPSSSEGKGRSFRFLPSEGGIVCGNCPGAAGQALSLGALKTWKALQTSSPGLIGRVRISESIFIELQDVIPHYLELYMGRRLRSLGSQHPS